jgi:glucose-6-phosphate 1-dehydrogenase
MNTQDAAAVVVIFGATGDLTRRKLLPALYNLFLEPNRLVLQIQPEEGIRLRFQAKHPGASETLSPVDMQFRYRDFFAVPTPDAYETLLLDVMLADATLFMRADQVESAWAIVDPILNRWEAGNARPTSRITVPEAGGRPLPTPA